MLRFASEGETSLRRAWASGRPLIAILTLLAAAYAAIRIGVIPGPLDMADYLYLRMYEGNAVLLAEHVIAYVAIGWLCARWFRQFLRSKIASE